MVFIETEWFAEAADELLSDDGLALLQRALVDRPGMGPIIQGTGGIRKIRWAIPRRGKRGGVRVIYYWCVSESQIFLLDIYAKNEQSDLTKAQKKALSKIVERWLS